MLNNKAAALVSDTRTSRSGIEKAKWFRDQYILAVTRALHAAESESSAELKHNHSHRKENLSLKKRRKGSKKNIKRRMDL